MSARTPATLLTLLERMLSSIAGTGAPALLSSPSAFSTLRSLSFLIAARYQSAVGGALTGLPGLQQILHGTSCPAEPIYILYNLRTCHAGSPNYHLLKVLLPYVGLIEWAAAIFQPSPAQIPELLRFLRQEPSPSTNFASTASGVVPFPAMP